MLCKDWFVACFVLLVLQLQSHTSRQAGRAATSTAALHGDLKPPAQTSGPTVEAAALASEHGADSARTLTLVGKAGYPWKWKPIRILVSADETSLTTVGGRGGRWLRQRLRWACCDG